MSLIRTVMQKILFSLLVCSVFASEACAGVIFNLTDRGGAAPASQARAGFQAAADFWSTKFSDNITVNLDIGFTTLGAGILGSAGSENEVYSYSQFRAAIASDITSADDATFSAGLPGGSSFNPYINRTFNNPNGSGSATGYLDNDGDANNTQVRINRATAKALGLLSGVTALADASITFSSLFSFDFDRTNGITAGTFDFVGVAIHEIGHALGFVSGVDILDINSPPANVNGPFADDLFNSVSPLDFTRFSTASQTAGADLDWTADSRAKYFSLDGGAISVLDNAWSLGKNFGDGQQASHWKDNGGIGIMDPTFASGELGVVSSLDLRALDAIGFNLSSVTAVPEPASVGLLALGSLTLGFMHRRKRRAGCRPVTSDRTRGENP